MSVHLKAVHRYCLPLVRDLVIAGRHLKERHGIFVTLEDQAGNIGIGEIAPLPGLHKESVASCLDLLRSCNDWREDGATLFADLPAVQFGLSMARINLEAERRGVLPAALLHSDPLSELAVNGLVMAESGLWQDEVTTLVEQGYLTVKIKVGRGGIDEEVRALRELQERYRGRVMYVLDGNRAWSMDEAVRFFAGVSTESILYGEELLRDVGDLADLARRVDVPMALDETLCELEPAVALVEGWPGVFVLKPDCVTGGVDRCLALSEQASAQGQSVVISSSFQSLVGLSFLAQLGAALRCPHAGLDTCRWFGAQIADSGFSIRDGKLQTGNTWINRLDGLRPYITAVQP